MRCGLGSRRSWFSACRNRFGRPDDNFHGRGRSGERWLPRFGGSSMSAVPNIAATQPFDPIQYRPDFPVLARRVHGKPLIYLDSANTAQKPAVVIDAVARYYREYNANVARAVHTLGEEATAAYEGARDKLARFINVPRDEIVFTSGTTN